jgi:sulfur carrier protein
MLTVSINDLPRPVAAGTTLADLLRELAVADRRGIAVAVNDEVVPRRTWSAHALADNDRVLVIQATQGG